MSPATATATAASSTSAHGIALDLLQYVPLADPVKISRLTLRNRSGRAAAAVGDRLCRMGARRVARRRRAVRRDGDRCGNGAMFARNPWSTDVRRPRRLLPTSAGSRRRWTGDRAEFIGRNGALAAPAALGRGGALSGTVGAGLDPCAALADEHRAGAGETRRNRLLLGQGGRPRRHAALIARYRARRPRRRAAQRSADTGTSCSARCR